MPDGVHMLHVADALLVDGWARDVRLGIENGRVALIEVGVAARPGDDRVATLLPGLLNLHSHAFQRGMAGLAETRGPDGDSFWTWRETMYRFVDRLTPDDLHAIAALAYIEMLESGFTRVGEFHYLHHDRDGYGFADPAEMSAAIFAAARESGIALTHLPVFYAHAGFGGKHPDNAQRRFVHDLDRFAILLDRLRDMARASPDTVIGLAPHSLRAVTPEELAALERMAGAGPIHIHVAEQVREVEECLAWSGARPVEWLLGHAAVGDRWCLVHATHVSAEEARGIAAHGAVVGLCPITEANLGDGLFPADPFLASGGRYGIGTDSNVLIDAAEELRLLEYGQRLATRTRNVMARDAGQSSGDALFRAALAGGAQALGAPTGIATGHPADFVSLDADHPSLAGRRGAAMLDALIFAARGGAIATVWRRGEKLVEQGRHRDRSRIAERYRRTLARLLA